MTSGGKTHDYPGLLRLDGRGFMVLGAGDGIGAQTCHALRQCGGRVVCVDVVEERAQEIAEAVGGHACVADVTTSEGVRIAFDEARRYLGVVRGIVDVIGMARIKPLAQFDDAELEWQLGIVLRHALYTLRSAADAMPQGGPITFVGSLSGNLVVSNQLVYGTAKAALHHLVRSAAQELGPRAVRVNAVAPGFIRTPRLLKLLNEAQWAQINRKVPSGRAATPEEIAAALLFLSSDLAAHVNGVVMPVDGGVSVSAALPDLQFGGSAS